MHRGCWGKPRAVGRDGAGEPSFGRGILSGQRSSPRIGQLQRDEDEEEELSDAVEMRKRRWKRRKRRWNSQMQ